MAYWCATNVTRDVLPAATPATTSHETFSQGTEPADQLARVMWIGKPEGLASD